MAIKKSNSQIKTSPAIDCVIRKAQGVDGDRDEGKCNNRTVACLIGAVATAPAVHVPY